MKLDLSREQLRGLEKFARYIWWKTPEQALKYPDRLIAQVMNMGLYEDVCALVDLVGTDVLRKVLQNAEIGQFDAPSWHYWHYRLTDIKVGEVPPMPVRKYQD